MFLTEEQKELRRQYWRDYYAKNKDRIRKTHRKWYEKNSEHIKEQKREDYRNNKEKYLIYQMHTIEKKMKAQKTP